MKTPSILLMLIALACAPTAKKPETDAASNDTRMFRFANADETACGYVNVQGDTLARFALCFSADTVAHFATGIDSTGKCVAIDSKGQMLYQVYWFDNGPDYASEGLFRMKRGDLIGYADAVTGAVVIEPAFQCASPFEEGKAQVAYQCTYIQDGEHERIESDAWFFINKKGEKQ